MFIGRHGERRAIICKDSPTSHATDLNGLTYIDLQKRRAAKLNFLIWIDALENEDVVHGAKLVRCYSNKMAPPMSDSYWRGLSGNAKAEFILVGNSNKSWLKRDTRATATFASDILRIIGDGGSASIVSSPLFLSDLKTFLMEVILPQINRMKKPGRSQIKKALSNGLKCGVAASTNYRGVLSDQLFVLVPDLMSPDFVDDSIVFELRHARHPVEFGYYVQDMRRLAATASIPDLVEKMKSEIKT